MNYKKTIICLVSFASMVPLFAFAISPDAKVIGIEISNISGTLKANESSSATYTITVTREGFGSRYAALTLTGLIDADVDFAPQMVHFSDQNPIGQDNTATSILTITTSPSTPSQSLCFVVTATGVTIKGFTYKASTNKCVVIAGKQGKQSFFQMILSLFKTPPASIRRVPSVSTIKVLRAK